MQTRILVGMAAVAGAVVTCSTGGDLFSEATSGDSSTSQTGGNALGSGGTANGGGGGGNAGSTSTSQPVCATRAVPSDVCDPVCDNCTADGACVFQCDGNASSCENTTLDCPDGMVCSANCSNGGCQGTIMNCAAAFQCNMFCSGDQSCRDANLNCAESAVCVMICNPGDDVCRDANVNCQNNWCQAQCDASVNPTPDVACDSAGGCPCAECG